MSESINSRPPGRILKVAAYIRVSTDHTDQEDSYEQQKSYFSERLANNPYWISAGIYTDYGISGTSRERRTGFIRLLRHCEEGRIDHIITKSISRFARNTRDFLKALDILKSSHVTIDFEKEHLNTAITRNDLILTTFGAIAQEESRSISANIQWGIRRHYSRGEARNIPIYGYRYMEGDDAYETTESGYSFRKVEIVEAEAAVVRRIFTEAAGGTPFTAIAKRLNLDRIPAPAPSASRTRRRICPDSREISDSVPEEGWTARHITQIVRLERYTGDLLLQKTCKPDYSSRKVIRNKGERDQYYVQNHHPAIISRELFQEVQAIRKANSARCSTSGIRTIYPFSGLVICGHCGRSYRTKKRSGHPVWYCASTILNNGRNICNAEKIYEEQLFAACCRAAVDRFHLIGFTPPPFSFPPSSSPPFAALSAHASAAPASHFPFFKTLIQKLEHLQTIDNIEHDRAYLIAQTDREDAAANTRKTEELTRRLNYLEAYWSALESTYDWRKKAIEWMKSLQENQSGITEFLNGLVSTYTKAFILSITIFPSGRCHIHWFDDTWSAAEISPVHN